MADEPKPFDARTAPRGEVEARLRELLKPPPSPVLVITENARDLSPQAYAALKRRLGINA